MTECSLDCTTCTSPTNCTSCKPPAQLIRGACITLCNKPSDCTTPATFCGLDEQRCIACPTDCTECKSGRICGKCVAGKQVNINAACENVCTEVLKDGEFCQNGTVKQCLPGVYQVTSECKCGDVKFCSQCSKDGKCQNCLAGYVFNNGVCDQCDEDFYQYLDLCMPVLVQSENCTSEVNGCLPDTYCPAVDISQVKCKTCDSSIQVGQGCNCKKRFPNVNCMACADGVCTECINGYTLDATTKACVASKGCGAGCAECDVSGKCTKCDSGFSLNATTNACEACGSKCSECSSPAKCTKCAEGFKQVEGICIAACDAKKPCSKATEFCDMTSLTCQACGAECSKCKTKEVCGGCTDATKKLNINGVCEVSCTPSPTDGQYCKAGTATPCAAGLTSECVCKAAKNCASCTTDFTMCLTCLPGFKLVAGACEQCADGYEKYETMCLGAEKKIDTVSKLSGGAIAGIVIACLVVAGGVGGGLAYYFIRKGKSGAAHTVQQAGQQ